MGGFSYAAPRSLDEALVILAERGAETSILAGGMVVVAALKQGSLQTRHILNIKGIGTPADPVSSETVLTIGALVRHRRVEGDAVVAERLPALRELERNSAAVQIRNCGTLVGNLCAAEPWTDFPCLMAALGARLGLASAKEKREIAADDWVVGPAATRRRPDEMVARVEIPLPLAAEGFGHSRLALRQGLAPPIACAAARVSLAKSGQLAGARIFVGAVGPRPQRMARVEEMFLAAATAKDIDTAVARDIETLADPRCGTAYKKDIAGVLVRRAVADAIADAKRRSA
jgi:aerobic carbon-monoxide dehydrogenase medium subunit